MEEPTLKDVSRVVVKLTGFLRDHGVLEQKFLNDFELAAAEAINNAVEHGCAGSLEPYFEVRLCLAPEFVELEVEDPSQFSGGDKTPGLPEDPLAEGGRGFFLLSKTADEVEHRLEKGKHVLVVRKKFLPRGGWNYEPGKSEQTLQDMTEELLASYEMINTLIALGELLATAPNMTSFIHGALSRLCETTRADVAYVRYHQAGILNLLYTWGETYGVPPKGIHLKSHYAEAEVFNCGNEMTLPRCRDLEEDDPLHHLLDSAFLTPVIFKEVLRGILVLGRVKPQPYFNAGQLKIARTVAEYLGIFTTLTELQEHRAIEERASRDLEIAAQIQSSMLPREFSGIEGLDVYGMCSPALQAGGDYFDVICLRDGGLFCLIADVMGKG
ncbi:MAG: ATP-binding protein, partial [Chthoniobacterales bacterium]|nr:ATP-binding protein [Chthoniobacterales bacterium]